MLAHVRPCDPRRLPHVGVIVPLGEVRDPERPERRECDNQEDERRPRHPEPPEPGYRGRQWQACHEQPGRHHEAQGGAADRKPEGANVERGHEGQHGQDSHHEAVAREDEGLLTVRRGREELGRAEPEPLPFQDCQQCGEADENERDGHTVLGDPRERAPKVRRHQIGVRRLEQPLRDGTEELPERVGPPSEYSGRKPRQVVTADHCNQEATGREGRHEPAQEAFQVGLALHRDKAQAHQQVEAHESHGQDRDEGVLGRARQAGSQTAEREAPGHPGLLKRCPAREVAPDQEEDHELAGQSHRVAARREEVVEQERVQHEKHETQRGSGGGTEHPREKHPGQKAEQAAGQQRRESDGKWRAAEDVRAQTHQERVEDVVVGVGGPVGRRNRLDPARVGRGFVSGEILVDSPDREEGNGTDDEHRKGLRVAAPHPSLPTVHGSTWQAPSRTTAPGRSRQSSEYTAPTGLKELRVRQVRADLTARTQEAAEGPTTPVPGGLGTTTHQVARD
jgi:hypothetical protein